MARRTKTDGQGFLLDPICPLCHDGVEDDLHMITSCSATHTASVLEAVTNVWRDSFRALRVSVTSSPPIPSLQKWRLQLGIGLIPTDLLPLFPGEPSKRAAFFGKISIGMIEWFGARMRERELLRSCHDFVTTDTAPAPASLSFPHTIFFLLLLTVGPRLGIPCV